MNGFISMGETPSRSPPTIPGSSNVVSPYGANIDTKTAGRIIYTPFFTIHPEMSNISDIISAKMGVSFTGTRMMLAEWTGVAKSGGSSVSFVLFTSLYMTTLAQLSCLSAISSLCFVSLHVFYIGAFLCHFTVSYQYLPSCSDYRL